EPQIALGRLPAQLGQRVHRQIPRYQMQRDLAAVERAVAAQAAAAKLEREAAEPSVGGSAPRRGERRAELEADAAEPALEPVQPQIDGAALDADRGAGGDLERFAGFALRPAVEHELPGPAALRGEPRC